MLSETRKFGDGMGRVDLSAFLVHSKLHHNWNPIAQNVAQGMFEAVETFQCELSWILKSHEGNSFGNPLFQVPFYHEQWNHSHAPHLTRHPAQKTPELSMLQETKDHTDKGRQQIHIVYKYQHPNHIRWSLCLPCTCFEYSEVSRYHKLNHKIQNMFNQCFCLRLGISPNLASVVGAVRASNSACFEAALVDIFMEVDKHVPVMHLIFLVINWRQESEAHRNSTNINQFEGWKHFWEDILSILWKMVYDDKYVHLKELE